MLVMVFSCVRLAARLVNGGLGFGQRPGLVGQLRARVGERDAQRPGGSGRGAGTRIGAVGHGVGVVARWSGRIAGATDQDRRIIVGAERVQVRLGMAGPDEANRGSCR